MFNKYKPKHKPKLKCQYILAILALVFISACSNLSKNNKSSTLFPETNTSNIDINSSKTIEGKFSISSGNNINSGLFTWYSLSQGWQMSIKSPLDTNIANVLYGSYSDKELENIRHNSDGKIYKWEDLPQEYGLHNINPQDISIIMHNINSLEKLTPLMLNNGWKIQKYIINADGVLVILLGSSSSFTNQIQTPVQVKLFVYSQY